MLVERALARRGLEEFVAVGPRPELARRRLDMHAEAFWRRARRELFLLRDGGRVVGRVAAIETGVEVGHFGWLSCPDDPDAARALLEAASQWLRERGARVARGPLHLGMGEEQGALLEGFDPPPGALLPDNPAYLPALLTRVGASVVHERHGYGWSRHEVPPPPASLRVHGAGREVVYRTLDPARASSEAASFVAAYNASNQGRFGWTPLGLDEARARVRDLLAFGDPRLIWLAEVRGEAAGVIVAMPELADGGAPQPAGRGPLGALRALRGALAGRRIERAHVLTVAVDPRFRGLHVGVQLILRAWRTALDLGVREAEMAGIDAGDEAMHQLLWRLGCRRLRRYGVFELPLR
jgi:GNAT superfamily N-acetyltransferase